MSITGIAFLLVFFTGMALALFRDPVFGLYTYVAEFYLSPPSRWWGAALPDLRWSFLAAGVTLAALVFRLHLQPGAKSWLSTTPAKIMITYILWFWLESLWALDGISHNEAAMQLTKYVVVFYLIYRTIDTPSRVTTFLLMHVAGCLYIGVLAYGIGAGGESDGRLDGVGGPGVGDANTLGMQMATGVVVASMLALHLKGWRLLLCIAAIAFALNAIVLAGSRGAFISLLAGGLALGYLKPATYRRRFYVFAMLGVMSIGYLATEKFWDRMATSQAIVTGDAAEMDISAYSRIEIIKAQWKMAKMYPFGTGHRGTVVLNYQLLDQKYMSGQGGGRSSHNVFMTLLVEEGIPGVILFCALVGWTASTLRRLAHSSPREAEDQVTRAVQVAAIGGALTVVLVAGIFADFSLCEIQIWMLAALAALQRLPLEKPNPALVAAPAH